MSIVKIVAENIKIPYSPHGADIDSLAAEEAEKIIKKKTGCKPVTLNIAKKSLDARRRNHIVFVVSVCAELNWKGSPKSLAEKGFKLYQPPKLTVSPGEEKAEHRHIIVGFGPAGMFAGLLLAKYGFRPVIYERGAAVSERVEKVEHFISSGELDTDTNIQFGAGGAGTFSDGKLTTRINDPLVSYIMEQLHALGAPDEILWKAKPHIGTDILRKVVERAHDEILALGGEIHYNARVSGITDTSITVNGDRIPYSSLILAIGHSARDIYAELISKNYVIEPKPFSAGVRIEHLQSDIDKALFGDFAGDSSLGKGEYQLSYRRGDRGTYTFCMCPGGEVVPSASEEGGVVTNGMSRHARDGRNANAAVCVSVKPGDYGETPEGAIAFQRMLERSAYQAGGGGYVAPMQTVGDFLSGKSGTEPSRVLPTYGNGKVKPCDFRKIFPPFITDMLAEGLVDFGRKMAGYAAEDVPLTGVETRTSAPVRIMRTEDYNAVGHKNIYPCGEGAGYAGGIVSAAVDGIRVGSKIISRFKSCDR